MSEERKWVFVAYKEGMCVYVHDYVWYIETAVASTFYMMKRSEI